MRLVTIGVLLVCSLLEGCASQRIGAHQAAIDNVQLLRQPGIGTIAVGEFKLAPDAPSQIDKVVTVRGSRLTSPSNDSFAAYLRESMIAELNTAGKYDPASTVTISGQLLQNELNAAGISKADSTIEAKFSVARGGAIVFDKRIEEKQTWDSSFIGAVAIPEAINRYTEMYTKLLHRLFADEEFRAATAK